MDDSGQRVDQIDDVVSFIEDLIDGIAGIGHLTFEAEFYYVLHEIWMGLVTDFEHVFLVDIVKSGSSCLHIIEGISHVTFCSEDQSLEPIH